MERSVLQDMMRECGGIVRDVASLRLPGKFSLV